MLKVERNEKEVNGSLLRRFNRQVSQAGILATAKKQKYFQKKISKKERRVNAINRRKKAHF